MNNPLIALLNPILAFEFERIEQYLKHFARATPNAEACVLKNNRLTYSELSNEVDACASALANAGVVSGDFVATHAPPGIHFLVTFLATQICGATWVGINPKYQQEEISYLLKDAKPKVVFVSLSINERNYAADFIAIKKNIGLDFKMISLDKDKKQSPNNHLLSLTSQAPKGGVATLGDNLDLALKKQFLPYSLFIKDNNNNTNTSFPNNPSANCMMVYTSGSTGQAKGALLPHKSLIRAARIRYTVWHQKPMRTLLNVPINHIGGAGDITCTTLIGGGTLICMEKFDPLETLKIIEKEQLSFLYQTPTQLQMTFFLPEVKDYNYSSLQAVVWSGARASQPLIEKLSSFFNGKLGTDYSMTESVGAVTMTPLTSDQNILGNSVGWPVPDRQVNIQVQSGEIVIKDQYLMSAYYNRPEASRSTIDVKGMLHTNDVGKYLPNGTIALTGRMSNMFKSGGYNVYPAEVETILETHQDILSAVVIAAPDELWGETGHAFLIKKRDSQIDPLEIKAYCHRKLANYKIPKSFIVLDKMPKLAIGKIDRAALKSQLKKL